jgi:GntR family transcriptional regulator
MTDNSEAMSDNWRQIRRPLAHGVRDDLLRYIQEHGLRPGDQAPTEAQTSALFGVSRSTAREALRLLEQDGVIDVRHRRGRFVSAAGALRVERPINRFESVTEMVQSLGLQATSAVLSVTEEAASENEATSLSLEPGAAVIRLVRLRYSDERPLIYSVDTVPRDCLPGPVGHRDWTGSLTLGLAAEGHLIVSSAARLRAVELPEAVEERYHLHDLGPWLLVEETCICRSGRKVLYAEDYHRGAAIAFNVIRRR